MSGETSSERLSVSVTQMKSEPRFNVEGWSCLSQCETKPIAEQWLRPVWVSGSRRVGAPVDGDEYTAGGKGLTGSDQLLCSLQKPCCVFDY